MINQTIILNVQESLFTPLSLFESPVPASSVDEENDFITILKITLKFTSKGRFGTFRGSPSTITVCNVEPTNKKLFSFGLDTEMKKQNKIRFEAKEVQSDVCTNIKIILMVFLSKKK